VGKFSEISTMWIASDFQVLAFEVMNLFFGLAKNRAAALHKVTFVCKYVQNGGVSLDLFFKAS